jgi:hypothetical protein
MIIFLVCFFWRQPRLALNSLSSCLILLSAGIIGMHDNTQLTIFKLKLTTTVYSEVVTINYPRYS